MNFGLPEGWEYKKLCDAANIILGQSPSSDTYNEQRNGLPEYKQDI